MPPESSPVKPRAQTSFPTEMVFPVTAQICSSTQTPPNDSSPASTGIRRGTGSGSATQLEISSTLCTRSASGNDTPSCCIRAVQQRNSPAAWNMPVSAAKHRIMPQSFNSVRPAEVTANVSICAENGAIALFPFTGGEIGFR